MAIASLVSSIGGFVFLPVILHAVGVVLGVQSKKRINESGGTLDGYGLAQAGFVIGIIGLAFGAIFILFMLAMGIAFMA